MAFVFVVQSLGTYIHLQLAFALCTMGENRETMLAVPISDSMDTETTASCARDNVLRAVCVTIL